MKEQARDHHVCTGCGLGAIQLGLQEVVHELKFPFEEDILNLGSDEEYVIFIRDRVFIIKPANEDDIERIGHGYYCMD